MKQLEKLPKKSRRERLRKKPQLRKPLRKRLLGKLLKKKLQGWKLPDLPRKQCAKLQSKPRLPLRRILLLLY